MSQTDFLLVYRFCSTDILKGSWELYYNTFGMEYFSLSDLCKEGCHLWISMLLFTWIGWPIPLSIVSILKSVVALNHHQPFYLAAQQTYGLCYYAGIILPSFSTVKVPEECALPVYHDTN